MTHDGDTAAGFEAMLAAIASSSAYRTAIASAGLGLPDGVLPFSLVDEALVERTIAALRLPQAATLVDLGRGFGAGGISVAARTGADLVGIDHAASALAIFEHSARRLRIRVRTIQSSGERTGLPDESTDGVVSFHAMMWMDAAAVMAEIARILGPGARLVMTANEWLADDEPELTTVVRAYAPFATRAGLTVEEDETIPPGYDAAFYAAFGAHAHALRAELGDVADILLGEGTADRTAPRRARDRWLVARKLT